MKTISIPCLEARWLLLGFVAYNWNLMSSIIFLLPLKGEKTTMCPKRSFKKYLFKFILILGKKDDIQVNCAMPVIDKSSYDENNPSLLLFCNVCIDKLSHHWDEPSEKLRTEMTINVIEFVRMQNKLSHFVWFARRCSLDTSFVTVVICQIMISTYKKFGSPHYTVELISLDT